MPTARKDLDFSFNSTSVTYQRLPGGGGVTHVNLEGTATGIGAVLGTLPTSAGAVYQTDGVISLDGRIHQGKLTEWA